jgi:F-box-like
MDRLSDELLCAILSHIDPWTLARSVQYVSKRLRRLAMDNQLWYSFVPSSRVDDGYKNPTYNHWTKVDWHNEWKW